MRITYAKNVARIVFLLICVAFGCASASASPTLISLSDQHAVKLGGAIEYVMEKDGPLDLNVVAQLPAEHWQPTPPGYFVLGLTENIYWFRFAVVAQSDKAWQLSFRYFFNCDTEIYLWPRPLSPTTDNGAEKASDIGQAQLIGSTNRWGSRHYTQALPLLPGQVYDVYMRVSVPGPDKFAFVLEDLESLKDFSTWDNRWLGIFYGGFITMLLYNLFLALSTRSFTYGYYLSYMIAMLGYLMMMDGILQAELVYYYLAICAVVVFGCQFCRYFLHTRQNLPGADHFLFFIIHCAWILGVALLVFGPLETLTQLVMVLVAGYGFVLGSAGLTSRLRGNHVAFFFLIAWVFPLIGMFFTDLMYFGILPFSDFGYGIMNGATLIEAILLSMALADRINALRRERQRTMLDAKEKLELSNQALEKVNRLKDSFLGTISHELRTPMNGIIGTLALMRNSSVAQQQPEFLQTLETSSAQMLDMVERILLFSELQSGAVIAKPTLFFVKEWLAVVEQRWAPEFSAKSLKFSLNCDDRCRQWIRADRKKLDWLLLELLSNAEKFTAQGEVRLELQPCREAETDRWVLTVADSGAGIPADHLQRISEAFRQGQSAYNRQFGGLGIGMAICKELVMALGAEWRIESMPQQGTTIRVFFPVSVAAAPVNDVVPAATPISKVVMSSTEGAGSVASVAGGVSVSVATLAVVPAAKVPCIPDAAALAAPAILVVEDNAVNQMVMKKILESLGWSYCIANNGLEAVERAREKPYALILMDCQMPVMDGFEATATLRSTDNPNRETPIVAVTANATDQDRERCIASGMNDYLKKPVKPADINGMILRHVPTGDVDAVSCSG